MQFSTLPVCGIRRQTLVIPSASAIWAGIPPIDEPLLHVLVDAVLISQSAGLPVPFGFLPKWLHGFRRMVYLLRFSEEETFTTIVAMGDTLVPIHGQGFVPLVGTIGMTFRTELLLLSVVFNAEFFQFFVIYFHSCCF